MRSLGSRRDGNLSDSSTLLVSRNLGPFRWRVDSYIVHLTCRDIKDPARRKFIDQVCTSFSPTNERARGLIEIVSEVLRQNSDFRRLLADFRE